MSQTSRTRSLRSEGGITIVETVVAATILLGGMMAGFLAMDASSSATKTAERQAQAASVAERAIEQMQAMDWDQLELCETPAMNSDPGSTTGAVENPDYYVKTGNRFFISADYRDRNSAALGGSPASGEPLVIDDTNCAATATTAVYPGPVQFSSGGVTGEYWRFITWKDDTCDASLPGTLVGIVPWLFSVVDGLLNFLTGQLPDDVDAACATVQDSKRITVAVVVDEIGDYGPRKPIWFSALVPDINGGPILTAPGLYQFP